MAVTRLELAADSDWQTLRQALDPTGKIVVVGSLLEYAREAGAVAVLVEEQYLDQDFTAEFAAFYSRVYRRYAKLCRRLHFFSQSIEAILNRPNPPDIAAGLEELSLTGKYVGYVVLRPVSHAPIGKAVFRSPLSPNSMQSDVLVHSTYEAHVLGAVLKVRGLPLTQQDSRIYACAQASIWMAGRHFHSRHRGPWASTVDVGESATRVTDAALSSALPAGSSGLTIDHMVRALRAMGREALLYRADADLPTRKVTWRPSLRPGDIVRRYVDSGIPVIVGLFPWAPGMNDAHAVVAVGVTRQTLGAGHNVPQQATAAEFCTHVLVNDDQRGLNLRVPVLAATQGQTPYSLENAFYLIVPLPSKVFMPAEVAEKIAWGLVKNFSSDWPALKAKYQKQTAQTAAMGDQFCADAATNQIVARTYLTYGWRYKQRILKNSCSLRLKNIVLQQDFPRFVWVTEFGTVQSMNHLDQSQMRVFGHAVIDATSSIFWESRCVFHAPGYVSVWYQDPTDVHGKSKQRVNLLDVDAAYAPKIRGQ